MIDSATIKGCDIKERNSLLYSLTRVHRSSIETSTLEESHPSGSLISFGSRIYQSCLRSQSNRHSALFFFILANKFFAETLELQFFPIAFIIPSIVWFLLIACLAFPVRRVRTKRVIYSVLACINSCFSVSFSRYVLERFFRSLYSSTTIINSLC